MYTLRASITSVAAYVPPHKLTNAMLEDMVDTSDEWIVSRTGIHERRILKEKNLKLSMKYSDKDYWSEIIRKMDKKYALWANFPKDPSLN